jgi:hypothetical protein
MSLLAKRERHYLNNMSNGVYRHDATPASAALSWAAMSPRNRESFRPTSSRYVPDSVIRPSKYAQRHQRPSHVKTTYSPSSTTIRSARAIVDSRWATITHVVCLCAKILSIASLTRCSLVASSALVASSNARIAGRFRSARAMARRWRWPPLKLSLPTKGGGSTSKSSPAWDGDTHSRYRTPWACPRRIHSWRVGRHARCLRASRWRCQTRCWTRSCP